MVHNTEYTLPILKSGYGLQLISLLICTVFVLLFFAPSSQAMVLSSRSAEMRPFSTCDSAGSFKIQFNKNDHDQIQGYLATKPFALLRISFYGKQVSLDSLKPVLCKSIKGGTDLPWQNNTVALDVMGVEVSDVSTPDGINDVEAFVYGRSGDPFIEIYITGIQPSTKWDDTQTYPWIKVGLCRELTSSGDGYCTTICTNVSGFGPVSTLNISIDATPQTLTYNSSDNQIGHFLEGPDHDGVGDTEEQGPDGNDPSYDGNNDGKVDWRQSNVASFHTVTGDETSYITVETPNYHRLRFVKRVTQFGSPGPFILMPEGVFSLQIAGMQPGAGSTLTIYTENEELQTFFSYGKTSELKIEHWYECSFDGEIGAAIKGNAMVLQLIDGKKGDVDARANGIISVSGGPVLIEEHPVLFFPLLAKDDLGQTEIGIINPEVYPIKGDIHFYEASGDLIVSSPIDILGNAMIHISVDQIPENSAAAKISANGDLSGFTRYVDESGKRCSWQASDYPNRYLTIPHVATGVSWKTGFSIFNTEDLQAVIWITESDGSVRQITLKPHERFFTWLDEGQNPISLESSRKVAVVQFFESTSRNGDMAAVLLRNSFLNPLVVPGTSEIPDASTGIALMGVVDQGSIEITAHTSDGDQKMITLEDVNPDQRKVFSLEGLFEDNINWVEMFGRSVTDNPFINPSLMHIAGLAVVDVNNSQGLGGVMLSTLRFQVAFAYTGPEIDSRSFNLTNSDTSIVVVQFFGMDTNGNEKAYSAMQLMPETSVTVSAGDLFDSDTGQEVSHVKIRSSKPIYGYQTITKAGRLELLPFAKSKASGK